MEVLWKFFAPMQFKGSLTFQYGGNDVLQIYNVQQVKHRLNTTGLYIASTKVNTRTHTGNG